MDAHSKSPRPNSLKNKKNTNLALNSPKPNLKATTTVRQNMGVNRPSKGNNLNKNKIS